MRIQFAILVNAFIVLATQTIVPPAQCKLFGQESFLLKGSFRRRTSKELGFPVRIDFEESYSYDQHRAKLSYQINAGKDLKLPQSGTFLHSETNVLALHSYDDDTCSLAKYSDIVSLFNLEFIGEDGAQFTIDRLLGPSNLLNLIEKNKDKLVEQDDLVDSLRWSKQLQFKLVYNDYKLFMSYTQDPRTVDELLAPLQIIITEPDGAIILYTFSQYSLLHRSNEHAVDPDIDHMSYYNGLNGKPYLDHFNELRHFPCLRFMISSKSVYVFTTQTTDSFTFRSHYRAIGLYEKAEFDYSTKSVVSYDKQIGAMRVDSQSGDMFTGRTTKIYDFRNNNLHHVIDTINEEVKSSASKKAIGDKLLEDLKTNGAKLSRCVSSRFWDHDYSQKVPVSTLIAGSNSFHYAGLSRVRGILTETYTSYMKDAPVWIDPMMERDIGFKRNLHQQVTVYVMRAANGNQIPLVLQIDFLQKQENTHELQDTLFAPIYDFKWTVDPNAHPNIGQSSNLFSLVNDCTEETARDQSVSFEMVLKPDNMPSQEGRHKLEQVSARNLALVGAIGNSLMLPLTQIYDLDSRLVKSKAGDDDLAISFRVQHHAETITDYSTLSQGYGLGDVYFLKISFHDCFLLASHINVDSIFAYSNSIGSCLMSPRNYFKLDGAKTLVREDKEGPYKVLKITHAKVVAKPRLLELIDSANQVRIYDLKLRLPAMAENGEDLTYSVISYRINDNDLRTTLTGTSSTGLHKLDLSMIKGFGFADNCDQAKRIQPELLSSSVWHLDDVEPEIDRNTRTEMTLEDCEASCMSDLDCRSYSLCLISGRLVCSISTIGLRSESIMQQINESGSKLRAGSSIKLKLNDSKTSENLEVELVKHMNCDIYNKVYLGAFVGDARYPYTSVSDRFLYAAFSPEECAERCFHSTIDGLRADKKGLIELLSSDSNQMGSKKDRAAEAQARRFHMIENICRSFSYISRASLLHNTPSEKLDASSVDSDMYCLFSGPHIQEFTDIAENRKTGSPKGITLTDISLHLQEYQLNAEIFFKGQYGVGLKGLVMSPQQEGAIIKVIYHTGASGRDFEILREIEDQSTNLQIVTKASGHMCANLCFTQTMGPWPACRSYDVLIERSLSGDVRVICALNTMTLKRLVKDGRTDLIKDAGSFSKENPEFVKVWHYEPREGFAATELSLRDELRMAETEMILYRQAGSWRLSGWLVSLLAIITACAGLVAGVLLSARLDARRNPQLAQDRLPITTDIQFENQVDFKGQIPVGGASESAS